MQRDPDDRPDNRPRLALSVGVVGHRTIQRDSPAAKALHEVLRSIATAMRVNSERSDASAFYRIGGDSRPVLELVTGLAAGADQIAADALPAIATDTRIDVRLGVVLPCAPDEFRVRLRDDQGETTAAAFDRLFARSAAKFVLDGSLAPEAASYAYAAVGRTIIANADVLVAIWNGRDGAGRGGTQDVLDRALDARMPVILIDARGSETAADSGRGTAAIATVEEPAHLRSDPYSARDVGLQQARAIPEIVDALLHPPPQGAGVAEKDWRKPASFLIDKFRALTNRIFSFLGRGRADPSVEEEFLAGVRRRPSASAEWIVKRFENLSAWFIRKSVDGDKLNEETEKKKKEISNFAIDADAGSAPTSLEPLRAYRFADTYSNVLASRERSAVVLSLCLGVLAVLIALFGPLCADIVKASGGGDEAVKFIKYTVIGAELFVLLCLFVTVAASRVKALTARWLAYRFAAEMLRVAPFLRCVGRAFPLEADAGGAHSAGAVPRWAIWYAKATMRDMGLPDIDYSGRAVRIARVNDILENLVIDQYIYNIRTAFRMRSVDTLLERVGETCFLGTIFLLFAKIPSVYWEINPYALDFVTALTVLLPTISAACLAQREFGEYQHIERRSEYMARRLIGWAAKLAACRERIKAGDLLATQDVADIQVEIARHMASDSANWASVFETKIPVAG